MDFRLLIAALFIAIIAVSCNQAAESRRVAEQVRTEFENNVTAREQELRKEQQTQLRDEMLAKMRQQCEQKCTQASNDGCSSGAMTSLCSFNSQNVFPGGYIDISNDGVKGSATLRGKVCEDHVYCYDIIENCCATALTRDSCTATVSAYLRDQGMGAEQTASFLATAMDPGTCG